MWSFKMGIIIESNNIYNDVEACNIGYNQYEIEFFDLDGSSLTITVPLHLLDKLKKCINKEEG